MNKTMLLKMGSSFLVLIYKIKWLTTSFFLVLLLATACSNEKTEKIEAIKDRASLPMMHATDITTIISDSGVTRYRISTPQWDDYDKTNPPQWEFPSGIHFEKFNEKLKVDAYIHSRYAKFNKNEQLWELRGNVKANNLQGELFETPLLFWNQRQRRFYTDSVIKITQTSQIVTGRGFESNESMTKYKIRESKITFVVNENESDTSTTSTSTNKAQ